MDENARSTRLINTVGKFLDAIRDLDALQAGDYVNEVSPIKHAILEALEPHLVALQNMAARWFGQEEQVS